MDKWRLWREERGMDENEGNRNMKKMGMVYFMKVLDNGDNRE